MRNKQEMLALKKVEGSGDVQSGVMEVLIYPERPLTFYNRRGNALEPMLLGEVMRTRMDPLGGRVSSALSVTTAVLLLSTSASPTSSQSV
jgi:hypothetical protein